MKNANVHRKSRQKPTLQKPTGVEMQHSGLQSTMLEANAIFTM